MFRRNSISPLVIVVVFAILMVARVGMETFFSFDYWYDMILLIPGLIIAIAFHEFAHAYMSHKLGDPVPQNMGRLTLNPVAHIDPVGLVALIFAGFGWGKAVVVDSRYYKNRRSGEILVGLAGVATNFVIAVVLSLIAKFLIYPNMGIIPSEIYIVLVQIITSAVGINLILMVFNLLPIPPLDGFGVVTQIFKLYRYDWYKVVYENGFLILCGALLLDIPGKILSPIVNNLMYMLLF